MATGQTVPSRQTLLIIDSYMCTFHLLFIVTVGRFSVNKCGKEILGNFKVEQVFKQNKRMNGIKEHILHLFYQFVNCIQHIVIV